MLKYFKYKYVSVEQVNELVKIEPILKSFIASDKPFSIRIMPDHFQCFVHTIISQQLSNKAVDTIWNRLVMNFKKITPKVISKIPKETLLAIGLSPQKITLLKEISIDILDKKLSLGKLEKLSNNEIAQTLIKYKYVGQWTIDILLMFTYYRNNVLAKTDFGVLSGIQKVYSEAKIDANFLNLLHERLGEYATLFTFCMWDINNQSNH